MEEDIKLKENEGAIVLREDALPEIYAPQSAGDMPDSIRFTLAFLLYAVEREDWVEEFDGFVESVQNKQKDMDAAARRSQFEIIQGDKK